MYSYRSFECVYTFARDFYVAVAPQAQHSRDRVADLFAPPRFTKRAQREAQREALIPSIQGVQKRWDSGFRSSITLSSSIAGANIIEVARAGVSGAPRHR